MDFQKRHHSLCCHPHELFPQPRLQGLMERVTQLLTCATSNRGLQIQGARGTARWNSACACSTLCMDGLSGFRQPKMQQRNPRTHEELQRCFEQRLQRMTGAAAADPRSILLFSKACLCQERQNHNCQWKSSETHKGVQNKSSTKTQRKASTGLRVRLTV